jgi:ribulose 1,5-bisphosphate synthetase/thiazole synthase
VEVSADLVIAGGSFGAIELALLAARAGYRVALVEPRISLGREISAFHRPWIPAKVRSSPPLSFVSWIGEAVKGIAASGELAIVPGAMKRGLETALLDAGVELLYLCFPVGVVRAAGRIAGLVIATKSGRRVVLARAVVDATPGAILGRIAGLKTALRYRTPGKVRARRTLEFTNVTGRLPASLPVPPLGRARVRQGALGRGHILLDVEAVLDLYSADHMGTNQTELQARHLTMDAVERLVDVHSAFAQAGFAQGSYELMMPPAVRVIGSVPGLFALGAATVSRDADAWAALNPVNSARAGAAMWPMVHAALDTNPRLEPGECHAICGRPVGREPRGRHSGSSVREARCLVPVLGEPDVLVAGGGTCGAVAGAVAAEHGAHTLVAEMNSGLGGTGTLGGVPVYWMGWRAGYSAMVDARVSIEMARMKAPHRGYWADNWYSYWSVEAKMEALLKWNEEAGATVLFRTATAEAIVDRGRVRGALVATPDGLSAVLARVTVDSTGDGDLAAMAGAQWEYGSRPTGIPMWTHLAPVFRPGEPVSGFTTAADVTSVRDLTRFIVTARRRTPAWDYMPQVAPRESRRINCLTTVDLGDHMAMRRYPDTVAIFFSNPDVKGISDSKWFDFGIHPSNVEMELPFSALVPRGLDGILVGGRAHGVSHDALAAMRMQPDIQNQGGVIGLAAATAAARGIEPRRIDIGTMQDELIRVGVLPAILRERRSGSYAPSGDALRKLVVGLKGDEPFYIYQLETDVTRNMPVVPAICTARSREAVPLLNKQYARAAGKRRLLLARLLAWHGSRAGSGAILAELHRMLRGRDLPPRLTDIRNTNREGPDQGAMPEACNLIHALAYIGERRLVPILSRVVDRIDTSREAFRSPVKGPWYYADAVIRSAERLGDSTMVPVLERLHAKPGLHGLVRRAVEEDVFIERNAILDLGIGRALHALGSPRGAEILREYLSDCRTLYARHARTVLGGAA